MKTKISNGKKVGSRSETIARNNRVNIKKKLYAIAVDNYFKSVPDKNNRFKKLSPSDERKLIDKYRNDRQTLESKLTEHNIFFAVNYASKQAYRFEDYDELISLAMNGLRVAATTFDIDSGWRFNTWAAFYLKKFILRKFYVRKESEIDNHVGIYLDENVSTEKLDEDSEYMYSSLKNHAEPSIEERFSNTFVDDMEKEDSENRYKDYANKIIRSVETSSLSTLDKTVFSKTFIDRCSITMISKDLGKSRNVITESKNRVLTYINNNFSKNEIFHER